jgi:hypothetical protein
MKRITVVALLALTYFAGNLRASAQENAVQATIPFDFTVGHQLLPSGEYRVAAVAPNVVSISNAAKHVTVLSLMMNGDKPTGSSGRLVFNHYGNQYFLSKIISPVAAKTLDLPISKLEKQAQWEQGKLHVNDQTTIALK